MRSINVRSREIEITIVELDFFEVLKVEIILMTWSLALRITLSGLLIFGCTRPSLISLKSEGIEIERGLSMSVKFLESETILSEGIAEDDSGRLWTIKLNVHFSRSVSSSNISGKREVEVVLGSLGFDSRDSTLFLRVDKSFRREVFSACSIFRLLERLVKSFLSWANCEVCDLEILAIEVKISDWDFFKSLIAFMISLTVSCWVLGVMEAEVEVDEDELDLVVGLVGEVLIMKTGTGAQALSLFYTLIIVKCSSLINFLPGR